MNKDRANHKALVKITQCGEDGATAVQVGAAALLGEKVFKLARLEDRQKFGHKIAATLMSRGQIAVKPNGRYVLT